MSPVPRDSFLRELEPLHRLVHLELLGLAFPFQWLDGGRNRSINFGLKVGLDCLATLRRLEVLYLDATNQTLAEEDILRI